MELALFDFDNTLTTSDTYARFLRRVATPEQRARAWWLVGPWLLAYRLRLISVKHLRARVTRLVFRERHVEDIAALATGYADEVLAGMLEPRMLEQLRWHQAQGHTVVIVSGSLDLYLQPWCERMGVHLICNRLQQKDGRLTGTYHGGDCAPRKAQLIRERFDLAAFTRIHAYGDSREDRPMLALAHDRWYRGVPL